MEEIARTFQDLSLTPRIYEGATKVYRFVGRTALADETPETQDKSPESGGDGGNPGSTPKQIGRGIRYTKKGVCLAGKRVRPTGQISTAKRNRDGVPTI